MVCSDRIRDDTPLGSISISALVISVGQALAETSVCAPNRPSGSMIDDTDDDDDDKRR